MKSTVRAKKNCSKIALATRLGGAISKYSKKLSRWGCLFVCFDETFDNNNFFERDTGNQKLFLKFAKSKYLGKTGDLEFEVEVQGWFGRNGTYLSTNSTNYQLSHLSFILQNSLKLIFSKLNIFRKTFKKVFEVFLAKTSSFKKLIKEL